MLGNPELSWAALAAFSRSMAQMLDAGVEIRKCLKTSSRQSVDARLQPAVDAVAKRIASGKTLTESIQEQGRLFPPLFCDLVNVGESTGAMPEVFAALAKYYESRIKQSKDLRTSLAWPAFNLIAATGVIGMLILILGILPSSGDFDPASLLGIGLSGPKGAIIWFTGAFALAAGILFAWKFINQNLAAQMALHPMFLQLPVIGTCMKSFAIARFSWCFALTQKAGMSLRPSLNSSLKATGNGAFMQADPIIWNELDQGETFTDALAASRLFPVQYLQYVETAEQTGTVPEQLDRMSAIFEDDALRAMSRLTKIIGGTVWAVVAGIIIFFIFRVVLTYVGMLNSAIDQTNV